MEVALPPVGSRPVHPENCATSLPAAAATLAAGSFHMVDRRTPVESAPGWFRGLVGLNGPSISALTRSVRRPPKVGPRDRKAAREPDLRVRLTAGVTTNAAMVDGLPNSTLDERHLDCKCLRRRQMRSLMQLVWVLENDVET